ncbi:hypothetical protein [Streptomyces sp. NBC_00525]|uniref:hypothetical protein n=1 Tax=Streptomyces sp. NBC_00525 TaxID=2903660 RepID=UPI002E804B4B|nr:hypothetical protein [Streptomyces sp. NBC_00525]WUC92134.1 hypothetical protein OG710_00240 [Streptomyces sp. NBC_00525]
MEHGSPSDCRLNGAEAIVIIVVVTITAALKALTGVPTLEVLQLLAGVGLIAGATTALGTRLSFRVVRTVLEAALTAP